LIQRKTSLPKCWLEHLPLEVSHLVQHATAINAMVLVGNEAVVAYMALRLWRRRAAGGTTSQ
jgi:uncharacterized membrane protein (DUF2068 family)